LNIVEKISERNYQITKESNFCYEITEEMKEKAHKISNSLTEDKLRKFVILCFQRNIILEDEEHSRIEKKSSNGLNKNIDIIFEEKKSENENNDKDNYIECINSNDLKKPFIKNSEENTIQISCIKKKMSNKDLEKEENVLIDLLNSLMKTNKNFYYHIIKKNIYAKLERNTKSLNLQNSDSDIHNNNNFLYSHSHNHNTYPLLKSLSFNSNSFNLKSKNRIENHNTIPQNFYHSKKSYNNDSLYNLFNSDCFNMHLIMFYLSTKDESSIIDLLVNIIYSKYINQSLFYIPQLCFLISNKKFYEAIENYVLDRCIDQIKFSLIAHWSLSSFIEHDDLQVVNKFDKFMQRVEMTLVNGRRATMTNYRMFNSLNKKSDEDVVLNSLDKEFRLEYFNKISKFYNDLKLMCEKLKKYPKEDKINPNLTRMGKLKSYLNRFNKKIRESFQAVINQKNMNYNNIKRKENENVCNGNNNNNQKNEKDLQTYLDEKIMHYKFSSKSLILFRGFILPFDDNVSTIDEYNTLIVNFLPEHTSCFSTKARVPVKLTVETIKVFEAEFWDDLIMEEVENPIIINENKDQDDGKSVIAKIKELNKGKIIFIIFYNFNIL
jgi:hypothetical protein